MQVMTDILHDALVEATLAALLGSTDIPQQITDGQGNVTYTGTITIPSAFLARIQQQAYKGDYDSLIAEAFDKITPEDLAETFKEALAQQMLKGLESTTHGYGRTPEPGWLQRQAKTLATEAATQAVKGDETLLDALRARIGAEVDRNRVGINVSLSDPEVTT